jgi:hypothetical protein
MAKTEEEHFIDWEGFAFGYGYGTGEPHTIPALRHFMALCYDGTRATNYDYRALEYRLGPTVAWLLINALCRPGVDVIEYGTSPRAGWLTDQGVRLRDFMMARSGDALVELVCCSSNDYVPCYPNACNCGSDGYDKRRLCPNPFWTSRPGI